MIKKVIAALQAKAGFTHGDIVHNRKGLLRSMKHMVDALEGDPDADKAMAYDLKQIRSRFDSLIDYEVQYHQQLEMIKVVKGVQRRAAEGELTC